MGKDLVPGQKPGLSVSLAALKRSVNEQAAKEPVKNQNTKAARLDKYKGNGRALTSTEALDMSHELHQFGEDVAMVDVVEYRLLDKGELNDLMMEYESLEKAELIAKARKERIKEMVFNHISVNAEQDGLDPETAPGEIEVRGKKFKKEGGGTQDPSFNLNALKYHFPEEYASLVDEVIIPESKIQKVNEKKLEEFLIGNPDRIEDLRESLVPGANKPFRFAVRKIDRDEE